MEIWVKVTELHDFPAFPEKAFISKDDVAHDVAPTKDEVEKLGGKTLSPIIMEVETHPKWKETNIGDTPFLLREEG